MVADASTYPEYLRLFRFGFRLCKPGYSISIQQVRGFAFQFVGCLTILHKSCVTCQTLTACTSTYVPSSLLGIKHESVQSEIKSCTHCTMMSKHITPPPSIQTCVHSDKFEIPQHDSSTLFFGELSQPERSDARSNSCERGVVYEHLELTVLMAKGPTILGAM